MNIPGSCLSLHIDNKLDGIHIRACYLLKMCSSHCLLIQINQQFRQFNKLNITAIINGRILIYRATWDKIKRFITSFIHQKIKAPYSKSTWTMGSLQERELWLIIAIIAKDRGYNYFWFLVDAAGRSLLVKKIVNSHIYPESSNTFEKLVNNNITATQTTCTTSKNIT